MFLYHRYKIAVVLCAWIVPAFTWATECGTASPRLQQMGDTYYNLRDAHIYSPEDAHMAKYQAILQAHRSTQNGVIKQLKGSYFRSGSGYRTRCKGRGDTLREEIDRFQLVDIERVETLNGSIKITAWEDNSKSRTIKSAQFDIPQTVQQPQQHKQHLHTLVDNRRLRRGRLQNPAGNSYLLEMDTEVAVDGNNVELTQIYYINGYRSEWVVWHLKG